MRIRAKTIQRVTTKLLTAAVLAWAPLANAQAVNAKTMSPITSQDRTVYKTLYGEKLSSVNRTRSAADDMTLVDEMIGLASTLPDDDVGVKCLIYADVITLASNASDLALMKNSLGLLEQHWPGQDEVSSEELMQLASRAYRAVDRSEREEQGEHYIDVLLVVTKRYEDQKDTEQAIGVCRLASTVARSIGSGQLESIDRKLDRLTAANTMAKRIKMLELSVQKNPQNSPAARELVKLLITQQNDPATAARYVASTDDEELIDLVHLCAQGIEQASAATAMRVGDWHLTLAEDERDEKALTLLRTARDWYDQFFGLYRRDDALAKRVEEMDNLALLRIERLVEANPELAQKDPDGWISLLTPPFDPEKYTVGRALLSQNKRGGIDIEKGQIMTRFEEASAYEIRLRITLNERDPVEEQAVAFYIPVKKGHYIISRIFSQEKNLTQVHTVHDQYRFPLDPSRPNNKAQLTFQVSESNGQVAFTLLHDEKPIQEWSGDLSQTHRIDFEERHNLPEGTGYGLFMPYGRSFTLHNVEYRKHR